MVLQVLSSRFGGNCSSSRCGWIFAGRCKDRGSFKLGLPMTPSEADFLKILRRKRASQEEARSAARAPFGVLEFAGARCVSSLNTECSRLGSRLLRLLKAFELVDT